MGNAGFISSTVTMLARLAPELVGCLGLDVAELLFSEALAKVLLTGLEVPDEPLLGHDHLERMKF